jgi:hypothetical protein
MTNVYKVTFSDNSVYFAAKQNPPGQAIESLEWARNQNNPNRPLVAAYLKHDGKSEVDRLHSGLERQEALRLKSKYIAESQEKT